ncbi:helix-turn-helix domain-containing protein [Micromonospora tulbaghiae]|uniref:helix-turn-helix domain-containing protein n=1 Tax=Micromonospora tulbaghiae TaxID=479978 RepID=UPI0036AA0A7D
MLEEIGLTPDEEELYRCLVRANTARAGELAQRLGRPRAEVGARLDALRDKGLVLPTGPEPDAPLRPLARHGAAGPVPRRDAQGHRAAPGRHVARWTRARRGGGRDAGDRAAQLACRRFLRRRPCDLSARPGSTPDRTRRAGPPAAAGLRRSGVPTVAAPTTPWPSPRQVGRIREAAGLTAAPGLTSSRPVRQP